MLLTRRHYTRLRHYWHGKASGNASLTDAIDLDLAAAGFIGRIDRVHEFDFKTGYVKPILMSREMPWNK